jgi:drug/metabolite transporter (DMT)-like permease
MNKQRIRSNIILLVAAAIWGFAFVAQRVGVKYIGSFSFNGIRFALGGFSLLPLIFYLDKKSVTENKEINNENSGTQNKDINIEKSEVANKVHAKTKCLLAGLVAGTILFGGATLQQLGMSYEDTTAGKAAFITGLYIVLVPMFQVFMKRKLGMNAWLGSVVAMVGLYLLCVTEKFTMSFGDLLVLAGTIFWTLHILVIDYYAKKVDVLKLALYQFIACSFLSLTSAAIFETITWNGLTQAIIPILYGGLCSVGIAYTLQIVGQRHAEPTHAAIILSMETVFAAIGGYLLLGETLALKAMVGCILMLAGILVSQLGVVGGNK